MAGLAGVFVIGVSCFMLWKRRNRDFAILSIRTASWFGLIGLILTIWTGDGSAVQVARHQPMKLAAMEGLYHGHEAQAISAVAILNPDKRWDNDEDEYLFDISIPYGLSILAKHDPNAFVPGIADIVKGVDIVNGDTVNTVSYAERIERGKAAHKALAAYDTARKSGRQNRNGDISRDFLPRRLSLFRLRILQQRRRGNTSCGTDLHHLPADGDIGKLLFFSISSPSHSPTSRNCSERWRWFQLTAMISVPFMWVCSEAGWAIAEVGRQPWTIQDLLPTCAAISDIPASSVVTTFWMFAAVFTILLVAEVSIMCHFVNKETKTNLS